MKKSHPMRRVLLAGAATASGIVLLLTLKPSGPASAGGALAPPGAQAPPGSSGAQAVGNGGPQTLTGAVEQTKYGPVQVRITVNGNKITKAEAVQKPEGGRSTQISGNSIPKLNNATVTAGNANIDAVTGASYTSAGYKKSLQSALDKAAKAQGSADGQGSGTGRKPDTTEGGSIAGSTQERGEALQGTVVETKYGPVQVRITIKASKITKAECVQMPLGGRSTQISGNAIPKLNQEAVTAGSADIDAVSGATYTSAGYKKSLQSALDNAGG